MKVKVDEKEYLDLIKKVERLERAVEDRQGFIFRSWEITEERLYRMMEQCLYNAAGLTSHKPSDTMD